MKLWVDDDVEKRPTPEGWVRVTNYWDAVKLLSTGEVTEISLDHDLGHVPQGYCEKEMNGYSIALFIVEKELDLVWHCHSQNVVGKKNIEQLLTRYDERRKG